MPIYVYRIVGSQAPDNPNDAPATFEVRQSIHDPPLTHHPETGEPIERVLCPPTIGRGAVGNSQLANAGMTKYVRTSDGTYEKQAGRGPKHVDPHGSE
jgi:predicted nucleic acid-binding Zn ribbon protein